MASGPSFVPGRYETVEEVIELTRGTTYTFTLSDSYGDGFDGTFALIGLDKNGNEEVYLEGPEGFFQSVYSVDFVVPGAEPSVPEEPEEPPQEEPEDPPAEAPHTPEEPFCQDSGGDLYLEQDIYGDCNQLSELFDVLGYLCNFVDVAVACPQTCNACQYQSVVAEENCAMDAPGEVDMGDLIGEQTCEWLQQSLTEGSSRFAATACWRTNVAFHCAATCDTCNNLERNIL